MQTAQTAVHVPVRADGIDARKRLISAALELFAQQGFQRTSVREVALAAQVNLASIRYYFGDKAGLYRAVFSEPVIGAHAGNTKLDEPGLGLEQRLRYFYQDFLDPLKHGDEVRKVIKLHYREMIEPTGVWQETIDNEIRPHHEGMLRVLVQELGLRRIDLDVHRLAFAIVGMAVQHFVCMHVVETIAPQIIGTARAIDTLAERLAFFAQAMVSAEKARRATRPGRAHV